MDYSNIEEREEFESAFGTLLQDFVAAGGVVAFPSSEGMLVSTTKKYFDTDWEMSDVRILSHNMGALPEG